MSLGESKTPAATDEREALLAELHAASARIAALKRQAEDLPNARVKDLGVELVATMRGLSQAVEILHTLDKKTAEFVARKA